MSQKFRTLTYALIRTLNAVADVAIRIRYQLPRCKSEQVEKRRAAFCWRTARTSISSRSSHPKRWTVSSSQGLEQLREQAPGGAGESPATRKLVFSRRNVPEAMRHVLAPLRMPRRNSLLDFDYQENSIPSPIPFPFRTPNPWDSRGEKRITCNSSRPGRESHWKPC